MAPAHGYNRAARLIEEMEKPGVGPMQSNGNREVLALPPPRLNESSCFESTGIACHVN
jgi:hypothetical protein